MRRLENPWYWILLMTVLLWSLVIFLLSSCSEVRVEITPTFDEDTEELFDRAVYKLDSIIEANDLDTTWNPYGKVIPHHKIKPLEVRGKTDRSRFIWLDSSFYYNPDQPVFRVYFHEFCHYFLEQEHGDNYVMSTSYLGEAWIKYEDCYIAETITGRLCGYY